jgi:hypothetical protein
MKRQRDDWQHMELFDCEFTASTDFRAVIFVDGTKSEYPRFQRKMGFKAKQDSSVCNAYIQWLDRNIPQDQIRSRYAQVDAWVHDGDLYLFREDRACSSILVDPRNVMLGAQIKGHQSLCGKQVLSKIVIDGPLAGVGSDHNVETLTELATVCVDLEIPSIDLRQLLSILNSLDMLSDMHDVRWPFSHKLHVTELILDNRDVQFEGPMELIHIRAALQSGVLEIKRWVLDVMISVDHPVDPAIPSMIRYIRKFSASPILIILDQLFDYFNIGKLTRINGLGLDGVIVDNDDQTAYIDANKGSPIDPRIGTPFVIARKLYRQDCKVLTFDMMDENVKWEFEKCQRTCTVLRNATGRIDKIIGRGPLAGKVASKNIPGNAVVGEFIFSAKTVELPLFDERTWNRATSRISQDFQIQIHVLEFELNDGLQPRNVEEYIPKGCLTVERWVITNLNHKFKADDNVSRTVAMLTALTPKSPIFIAVKELNEASMALITETGIRNFILDERLYATINEVPADISMEIKRIGIGKYIQSNKQRKIPEGVWVISLLDMANKHESRRLQSGM